MVHTQDLVRFVEHSFRIIDGWLWRSCGCARRLADLCSAKCLRLTRTTCEYKFTNNEGRTVIQKIYWPTTAQNWWVYLLVFSDPSGFPVNHRYLPAIDCLNGKDIWRKISQILVRDSNLQPLYNYQEIYKGKMNLDWRGGPFLDADNLCTTTSV
jgi:hypothetical protein